MLFDLENLPSDTALLHRLVHEMAVDFDSRDGEIERLQSIINKPQRRNSGVAPNALMPISSRLSLDGDIARIRERKAERPVAHLAHFNGILHVDGYAAFERLTGNGAIVLAACWAHTRRKFYEIAEATGSPVAAEALRRIGELYAVEVRGQSLARGAAFFLQADRASRCIPGWKHSFPASLAAARLPRRSVTHFRAGKA
jgi:hypothetical protein